MSEDTISRQAVIEINRSYHGQMPNEVNHRIWKEINELPSAQPDSKETSSTHKALDTISRQAALNALSRGSGCGASCHRAIKALPSAQPETHEERTETHACDLISRQAATEAIENIDWYHLRDGVMVHGANSKEDEPLYKAEDVYNVLNDMPSAQPEIIRCRDCRHFEHDHPYIIQGVPVLGHEVCNAWGNGCKTDENGYCFLAERRTNEQDSE